MIRGYLITSRTIRMRFPSSLKPVAVLIAQTGTNQEQDAFAEGREGPFPDFATHRDLVTGQDVFLLHHEQGPFGRRDTGAFFFGTLRRKGGDFFVNPWTPLVVTRKGFDRSIDHLPAMLRGKYRHTMLRFRVDLMFERPEDATLAKLLMG